MLTLLSHVWRSWKSAKGVALLAILALAVGIGCATAIFTVVDAVLLRPLPYSQGSRWVAMLGSSKGGTERDRYSGLTFADLDEYQHRTHSFDVFGWYTLFGEYNLTSPGQPQHIDGIEVTPSLVDNTGVNPIRGRLFTASDGADVALISDRLWRRLGANPKIAGAAITLSGQVYVVTGVMPPWFRLPIVTVEGVESRNDVWIPVKPPRDDAQRNEGRFAAYARLKPGFTLEQASDDAKHIASGIARERPQNHQNYTAAVFSLRESVVKAIRPILLLLFSAACLLLLITCANVAGLLVARSVGRAREIAIRVALGGSRNQLALQFFSEALFISLAAAALGALASVSLVRFVVSLVRDYIPRADEISLNWVVVIFAAAVACLAALLSALAPLWQALRTQPNTVLSEGVRASAGARTRKLSQILVIAEIALAFTLLSVSALLLSQLANLNRTSPGLNPNNLLTFEINFSSAHASAEQLSQFGDRLIQQLESMPGVSSAAFANQLAIAGCCLSTTLYPEGQPLKPDLIKPVSMMIISPGYFQTMQIPLRRGRLLNAHDTNENLVPVVIDQAAAERYWPGRNPMAVGGHIGAPDGTQMQVVGVVGNTRNEGLGQATRPEVYILNSLAPANPMQFVVRSPLPTATLVPAIRRAVQRVDAAQPIDSIRSMRDVVSGSLAFERVDSVVLTFFAVAALLMACLGIYGVTSYSVRQRTVEFGTRMALGAVRRNLLWLVVGSGLSMAFYGIAIGAVTTAGATWLVAHFFNVQDISPLPYLYSVVIVTSLAMFAAFFPAWRATLLSPMVAMRDESESAWTTARHGIQQALGLASAPEDDFGFDPALLTEFSDASHRASSFVEALHIALEILCEKVQASSAMLFENASGLEYRCLDAVPASSSINSTIPARGFLLNRLRWYSSPLAFTPEDLEASLRWSFEQNPAYIAEIETLQRSGMRLAVGLRTKNEVVGLLLLGAPPQGRKQYSPADKRFLRACAVQFALLIENARLTDRVVEQEKVRRDVDLAAQVQKRLLPQTTPESPAVSIEAFTLPARGVGGDYYDFIDLGDRRVGIALADVAGKGIAAALIMAVVQASLRIIASEQDISLPALAGKMNRFLHRSTGSNSYATFFYAQVDEEKRQLHYVNAGHNPPYLVRSPENHHGPSEPPASIEELSTGGIVIGLFPFANYEQASVDLLPGDVLLVFTDGVTEAMSPGDEEFGEERLQELLRRSAHLAVSEIIACISRELNTWINNAPQHDDITFIVVKVNPKCEN